MVVPAAGVVAEAMLALVLADALLEKAGDDSLEEVLAHQADTVQSQRAPRRPEGSRPPARRGSARSASITAA